VKDDIKLVNDLLKGAKITQEKKTWHTDVFVNDHDMTSAVRPFKSQFSKIKKAKEDGKFKRKNAWYDIGRSAAMNIPYIKTHVFNQNLPSAMVSPDM